MTHCYFQVHRTLKRQCAVQRHRIAVGGRTPPGKDAPTGSRRAGVRGNSSGLKPRCKRATQGGSASKQAVISMNIEQIPKPKNADADHVGVKGKLPSCVRRANESVAQESVGVMMTACLPRKPQATQEIPRCGRTRERTIQRVAREGQNPAAGEVGEARSTERSPVIQVEGRGLGLVTKQEEEKTRRDWRESSTCDKGRETSGGFA